MTGHAPRALEGRRIVITRAPEQAEELISRLTELGAEVLSLPMVRFVEPLDSAGLDLAIAGIEHFDWILFTSANAVRFFLARCRALDFPFESTESDVRPRIAVVGPATRDALELQGLGAKGEPKEFSGMGLIAALADDVMGKRVLLPRSDRATGELPAGLRAAGASVTEVVAYLTLDPGSRDTLAAFDAYVVKTLERGDADAVTFFSPSAFQNFARALGDTALRQMGARVAIAALGPVTAAAIRSAGLPVAIAAAEATTAGLVEAITRHFAAQPRAGVDAGGDTIINEGINKGINEGVNEGINDGTGGDSDEGVDAGAEKKGE